MPSKPKRFVDWDACIKYRDELFASLQEPIDGFLAKHPGLVCDRERQGADPRTPQQGGKLRIMLRFHMEGCTASKPIFIPKGGVRGEIDRFAHDLCKNTRLTIKKPKRGGVAMFYLLMFKAGELITK